MRVLIKYLLEEEKNAETCHLNLAESNETVGSLRFGLFRASTNHRNHGKETTESTWFRFVEFDHHFSEPDEITVFGSRNFLILSLIPEP